MYGNKWMEIIDIYTLINISYNHVWLILCESESIMDLVKHTDPIPFLKIE